MLYGTAFDALTIRPGFKPKLKTFIRPYRPGLGDLATDSTWGFAARTPGGAPAIVANVRNNVLNVTYDANTAGVSFTHNGTQVPITYLAVNAVATQTEGVRTYIQVNSEFFYLSGSSYVPASYLPTFTFPWKILEGSLPVVAPVQPPSQNTSAPLPQPSAPQVQPPPNPLPVAPITSSEWIAPMVPEGWQTFDQTTITNQPQIGLATGLGPFPLFVTEPNPDGSFPPQRQSYIYVGPISPNANPAFDYISLDPTLMMKHAYIVKWDFLRDFMGTNGRRYALRRMILRNVATGSEWIFYSTSEGGGPGLLLTAIAPTTLRVLADIATFGQTEIIHATDEDLAKKVDQVIGGGSLAVGAAVLTSGASIGAMGVITAAGAGAVSGAVSNDPSDVIVNSLVSGAVIGAVAGISSAYSPGQPVPADIPAGESAVPLGPDIPLGPQPLIGPSLPMPPTGIEIAPNVASVTPNATGLIAQTGSMASKAVATTVVSAGATALAAGIKRLTGQTAEPPQEGYDLMASNAAPAPIEQSPAISGKTLFALGAVALLGLMKAKQHTA